MAVDSCFHSTSYDLMYSKVYFFHSKITLDYTTSKLEQKIIIFESFMLPVNMEFHCSKHSELTTPVLKRHSYGLAQNQDKVSDNRRLNTGCKLVCEFLKLTYQDVTGGRVALFDSHGFTAHTAAAAAGSGRAWVIGVDGYTAGHFTSRGHNWFGGDFGFAIGGQRI